MDDNYIGLILGGITLIIPIVWMLTRHQQKMTLLLHQPSAKQPLPESHDVRREIAELREVVNQQTIAMDSLAKSQAEIKSVLLAREEVSQRIG